MIYISWNAPIPPTISSHQNKSIVKKQLYSKRVPSFPTFVTIKRQYFELLAQEIKCRYLSADLCAQIYANMLISSRCSLLTGQFAQWRGRDKNYCVGEVWTVSKWSRFTHEMWHCLQSAGKNHQTKTRARSTRLCLEENQKTNLDPPCVCPKLQVQATFYSDICLPLWEGISL